MSGQATLRVTPVELAGVAAQVRALTGSCMTGSVQLRNALGRVDPPDAAADQILLVSAQAAHMTLTELSELLASLVADLGRELDRQAHALAGAAHGYAYAERQLSVAVHPVERRRE